jgi:hypothetical protein
LVVPRPPQLEESVIVTEIVVVKAVDVVTPPIQIPAPVTDLTAAPLTKNI